MNWDGDIYCQVSADPDGYRIDTAYTHSGEFCTIKHKGKVIGYTDDTDKAKGKCEAHLSKFSPTAASAAGV